MTKIRKNDDGGDYCHSLFTLASPRLVLDQCCECRSPFMASWLLRYIQCIIFNSSGFALRFNDRSKDQKGTCHPCCLVLYSSLLLKSTESSSSCCCFVEMKPKTCDWNWLDPKGNLSSLELIGTCGMLFKCSSSLNESLWFQYSRHWWLGSRASIAC